MMPNETIKEQYRIARVVAMESVDWEVQRRLDAPPRMVERIRLASRPLLSDLDDAIVPEPWYDRVISDVRAATAVEG